MNIEELYQKMLAIEKTQNIILDKLDKLTLICSKMNNHIDFVENVYDAVRHPLTTFSRIALPSFNRRNTYQSIEML